MRFTRAQHLLLLPTQRLAGPARAGDSTAQPGGPRLQLQLVGSRLGSFPHPTERGMEQAPTCGHTSLPQRPSGRVKLLTCWQAQICSSSLICLVLEHSRVSPASPGAGIPPARGPSSCSCSSHGCSCPRIPSPDTAEPQEPAESTTQTISRRWKENPLPGICHPDFKDVCFFHSWGRGMSGLRGVHTLVRTWTTLSCIQSPSLSCELGQEFVSNHPSRVLGCLSHYSLPSARRANLDSCTSRTKLQPNSSS